MGWEKIHLIPAPLATEGSDLAQGWRCLKNLDPKPKTEGPERSSGHKNAKRGSTAGNSLPVIPLHSQGSVWIPQGAAAVGILGFLASMGNALIPGVQAGAQLGSVAPGAPAGKNRAGICAKNRYLCQKWGFGLKGLLGPQCTQRVSPSPSSRCLCGIQIAEGVGKR